MHNRLLAVKQFGQQIWLDNLSRNMLNDNHLGQMIKKDGIAGITSNPTIFHKAISSDQLYQEDLAKVKRSDLSLDERYESLVIPDIQAACDAFLPVYQQSNHNSGFVSFELSPLIANDPQATIKHAVITWNKINRPNLMIKIPATDAGIYALEQLIFAGININVTLIFSLKQVRKTWEAYLRGLTRAKNEELNLSKVRGVASFFLSRIDSSIDPILPAHLHGLGAINLAKAAYMIYQELFDNPEFAKLKQLGAQGQYLLFASTGTKNSAYSDVMYVEKLIGNETVNTVPTSTLDAFIHHGHAANSLIDDLDKVESILNQIEQIVNLDELGDKLQQDGLKAFIDSYNQLLELVK